MKHFKLGIILIGLTLFFSNGIILYYYNNVDLFNIYQQ